MKGIIFDLDGVIVFTDKYHYQAWKAIADKMDIYFDEKINDRLRGVSRAESLEIVLERYEGETLTAAQKQHLMDVKNEIYRGLLNNMSPDDVDSNVRETLKELRKRGYKLAIGSSSKNAKLILEKVDLLDAFDEISDGTNISKSKPDPEVFLKAAELIGEKSCDCLVVEDADAGIQAAVSGGFHSAAIGDAVEEKSEYIITKLSDLLKILK